MVATNLPKGYEYAEVSAAKDAVYNLLDTEVYAAGTIPTEEDGGPDLINLADRIVEELLIQGAVIGPVPEGE